jgi:hypothetical protein
VLFDRTVRQRRIPWIQLNIPGSAADLATGNSTDAQLNAVSSRANQRRAPLGPTPGGKKKKKKKKKKGR